MKSIAMFSATCLFAMASSIGLAQQASSSSTVDANTKTNTTTQSSTDTKNVRRARRAVPKNQPTANTPGSQPTNAAIQTPRNNTNAEVAGTPAGTGESNVETAKAHSNSDVQK